MVLLMFAPSWFFLHRHFTYQRWYWAAYSVIDYKARLDFLRLGFRLNNYLMLYWFFFRSSLNKIFDPSVRRSPVHISVWRMLYLMLLYISHLRWKDYLQFEEWTSVQHHSNNHQLTYEKSPTWLPWAWLPTKSWPHHPDHPEHKDLPGLAVPRHLVQSFPAPSDHCPGNLPEDIDINLLDVK